METVQKHQQRVDRSTSPLPRKSTVIAPVQQELKALFEDRSLDLSNKLGSVDTSSLEISRETRKSDDVPDRGSWNNKVIYCPAHLHQ